ncbi:efflux RND transporter periplasmic adaptor subunit [Xanthomonas sp. NCPPB 1067]|uniref:efflux RND transporter periplasmic adaptor subunit n=1 Tax=Xanthomonas sp. NCPPB 1067 TaxID=487524 RepID=UPI001E57DCFF|nr:efflux RND transporter periplasmic adaptor subunit [Xanthomonas sp. NCPPB 1067]
MNKWIKAAAPALLTLAMVAVAVAGWVLQQLWRYYMEAPWTRDAHVAADVVQVAPDVSGLVESVAVADNQPIARGQVLFVVDRARYAIALQQARAALAERQATLTQLRRESARDRHLQDLVAAEDAEMRRSEVRKAEAAVAAAQSALALAQLNLDRTQVRSPTDGHVSDRTVRVGDYVSAGRPVLAVLETGAFRVDGYFEETRLRGVHPGQRVEVHLMGEPAALHGHVQSIAAGIEDRYRSGDAGALPNVTPAFDWVRLAQRIPVRIALDAVPDQVRLIAGRTATVSILPDAAHGAPVAAPGHAPAGATP